MSQAVNMLRHMQDRNRYLAHRVESLEKALTAYRGRCELCAQLPADCRCDPCQKFLDSFAQMPESQRYEPLTLAQRARLTLQRALRKVL